MQPARRPATYDDLLALPEGVKGEVVAGDVVTLPSPRPRHSKTQRAPGHFLGGPCDDDDGHGGPGGWWIFVDVDVRFGADILRPELGGWRRERLPEPDVRPIDIVPDWVCEILSESSAAHDRVTKRPIYAEPARARIALFEAVELPIARIFLPRRA